MKVKLNAFRAGARPGDVVEVSDADGAALIAHGAGRPVDDTDTKTSKTQRKPSRTTRAKGSRTVRGEAALQAASGADTSETPEP